MKEKYLHLMEMALSAYTDEHILRYFNEVKAKGLTEHGFPRLVANLGILIAHGKRPNLLPLFAEMMEFCCATMPTVKAANDFSVREIVCCLQEVERASILPAELTQRWRTHLRTIDIASTYNVFAKTPDDTVNNWALFTAVSEYFRQQAGLCNSSDFIDLQLLQQSKWLDENGMYQDLVGSDCHHPILYDLVARGLFALLLDRGYCGAQSAAVDENLRKAGLLTLDMQSTTGEIPFGGRSNQFLHNEPWLCAISEYEAKRYAKTGNLNLASRFKAASVRALEATERWLFKQPIRHVKNRFAIESGYGCEFYAYFDKYMTTVASNLYAAYLICDDTIPTAEPDRTPHTALTSSGFHKLFLTSGGYALEFDLNADPHYDANGLGRVHRAGAPSAICLSCPCPAEPAYTVDVEQPIALSLCAAIKLQGKWHLGAAADSTYELLCHDTADGTARAAMLCRFADGQTVQARYTVSERGVEITLQGEGEIGFALPALCFDGETAADIRVDDRTLTVSYENWCCRYTTDGTIVALNKTAANRNGHYRALLAAKQHTLHVCVEIVEKK